MKIIKILSVITLSIVAISCSKEAKTENEVEVHVVEETHNEMSAGNALNVEVVNELDPICGMTTADHLKDTADYKGKTYGFCNTMCKEKFLENPEQYINE
ncbi:YHS domain-containing protein [Faecalibacter macacae]|uniref:YHS domain-containing protein n=1 Tax=Faecalibacter macacae TaxID=1859289 RepID=A0A3L9MHW5_9FLAO|nr:YHS domain-containing protein [Faecalibacter macacae]RLZ12285.1 YHS domain-containing protein [Faecalibacter macacae]